MFFGVFSCCFSVCCVLNVFCFLVVFGVFKDVFKDGLDAF